MLTPVTLLFTHGEETLQVKLIQNYGFVDLLQDIKWNGDKNCILCVPGQ